MPVRYRRLRRRLGSEVVSGITCESPPGERRQCHRHSHAAQAGLKDYHIRIGGIDRWKIAIFRYPAQPMIRRNEDGNNSASVQLQRHRQLDCIESAQSSLYTIPCEQTAGFPVVPLIDRRTNPQPPLRHVRTQAAPDQFPALGVEVHRSAL